MNVNLKNIQDIECSFDDQSFCDYKQLSQSAEKKWQIASNYETKWGVVSPPKQSGEIFKLQTIAL